MRNATVNQARALRRSAPSTERFLWRLLRDRILEGLKFRRQAPMGPYMVDFVCLRHRLVVEADGPFHDAAHDAERDAWLARNGFCVLRISNTEVSRDVVIPRILAAVGGPLAAEA